MFTPALVRHVLFNKAASNMCICSFRRLRHFSVFSRVLTVVTYPLFTRRLPLLFGLFSYDELRLYAIVLVCILVSVMSSFPL